MNIRKIKQGYRHNRTLWRKVSGISQDIADKTVKAILEFGNEHDVDVFVLEHLDFKGKNAVKRAHFWRYKRIYTVLTQKAHQHGLRIVRVNARNTTVWHSMGQDGHNEDEKSHPILLMLSCDLQLAKFTMRI